ncbi:hypothetical protein HRI_002064900 [Hibiscus trionum]|uniref:Btz domain-containing protein n=1 Tax=Hibiscus trionum TaxID=183268 RepID=A0A9W7HV58_HIBTR|nr:hypothetical protein HRI_002064900 [Hibiscus trionum]
MVMSSGEVESEYESETDGSVLLRRRTEATDDDKELEEEENKMAAVARPNASVWRIDDNDESDGLDGAPEYYDDYVDDEASYVDELEKLAEQVEEESEEEVDEHVMATKQRGKEKVIDADKAASAVPRFGAFYMHDDRLSGLRHIRRNQPRKKYIWESKDELKWMHDKFEAMTLEETRNKELSAFQVPKTSNYYHQGRNKNNTNSGGYKAKESRLHYKSGNDGSSSKIVKGRGPVRYKPLSRSISANPTLKSMQLTQGTNSKTSSARAFSANNKQHYKRSMGRTENANSGRALSSKGKQPAKSSEITGDTDSSSSFTRKSKQSVDTGMASHTDPASLSFHVSNLDFDSLPPHKHLLAPSISSYQQEFYPTSSFHHANFVTQRRMERPGTRNALFPISVLPNQIIHEPEASDFLQGNIALDIPNARSVRSKAAYLKIGSNINSSPQHTGILGDRHFNASPRRFPVRQFGPLHHGSLGNPAVDMTPTGYNGESQVLRNPDLARYATHASIPNNEGRTSGPSDSHHLPSPKTN